MSEIEVKSERRNGSTVTAKFDMPDDLAGLQARFGDDIVCSHVRRSLIIALQAFMRSMLDSGKSAEEIQAAVQAWVPGLKKASKTPLERAREEISKMSPADRKALAQEIRQRKDEGAGVQA